MSVNEGDTGKRLSMRIRKDAKSREGATGIRHEAFAAGFVDGGLARVGKKDVSAAEAERDGGGESGGSGTDD